MGTWVGSPYDVLNAQVGLWEIAEAKRNAGAEVAEELLILAKECHRDINKFTESFRSLAPTVENKLQRRREITEERGKGGSLFRPRTKPPEDLRFDVPGLANMCLRISRSKAPAKYYVPAPASSLLAQLCLSGLRLGADNLRRSCADIEKTEAQNKQLYDQVRDFSAGWRYAGDLLLRVVNSVHDSRMFGKWTVVTGPGGSKMERDFYPSMEVCRLHDETVLINYDGLVVGADVSCITNFLKNTEILRGLDAFFVAFRYSSSSTPVETIFRCAHGAITKLAEMEETMQGVCLARRGHIIWYAAFTALIPGKEIPDGLLSAPYKVDYETGRFMYDSVQDDVKHWLNFREANGIQLTETCLKVSYHVLPPLPQNFEQLFENEKNTTPVMPANSWEDEVRAAGWQKIVLLAASMGSSIMRATTAGLSSDRSAQRGILWRRWKNRDLIEIGETIGLEFHGDDTDCFRRKYPLEGAQVTERRGPAAMPFFDASSRTGRFPTIDCLEHQELQSVC